MVDVFEATDQSAVVRLDGVTLSLEFTFNDPQIAAAVQQRLMSAHARGESITFTLSNPAFDPVMQ